MVDQGEAPSGRGQLWQRNERPLVANDRDQPPLKKSRPATIRMPPKVYRPAIPSTYVEPANLPDPAEGLECLHRPLGHSLWRTREPPLLRNDIIMFNTSKHQRQLENNINWTGCKPENKRSIIRLVQSYWDVFAEEGLRNPIKGFQFVVDTGETKPICCRIPRYGMHEAPVIKKICEGLKHNG